MGRIAGRLADVVLVTDDNPRGEDPEAIAAEILARARGDAGGRRGASPTAARRSRRRSRRRRPEDAVLVAGKGHETTRRSAAVVHRLRRPRGAARRDRRGGDAPVIARGRRRASPPPSAAPCVSGSPEAAARGVSIDSRSVAAGDAFFAILGERHDGHDFVADAAAAAGAP